MQVVRLKRLHLQRRGVGGETSEHQRRHRANGAACASGEAARCTPVATQTGTAKPIIRYQDRRLVAMLFDFSTMAMAEQIRVQKNAIDFIHKQLKPADLVAIMIGDAPGR